MINNNFGDILYLISKALMDLGSKFTNLLSYNINITSIKSVLQIFGLNASSIPNDINVISLIGLVGGIGLLVIFVYKLFK